MTPEVAAPPAASPVQTHADPALVKALARAFRYQRLLDERRYASITEMDAAERIERGYLGTLLRLTLLAPDIVESILDGADAGLMGLPRLLQPMPDDWPGQHRHLASAQRSFRPSGDYGR